MKNCLQNRLLSILNVFDIFFMQREILDTYVTHIHGNIKRKKSYRPPAARAVGNSDLDTYGTALKGSRVTIGLKIKNY